jgi:hypothetical protein
MKGGSIVARQWLGNTFPQQQRTVGVIFFEIKGKQTISSQNLLSKTDLDVVLQP